jgi:hypothetical protein
MSQRDIQCVFLLEPFFLSSDPSLCLSGFVEMEHMANCFLCIECKRTGIELDFFLFVACGNQNAPWNDVVCLALVRKMIPGRFDSFMCKYSLLCLKSVFYLLVGRAVPVINTTH